MTLSSSARRVTRGPGAVLRGVTRLRTDDVASESGWPSAAYHRADLLPLPAMMFLAIRRVVSRRSVGGIVSSMFADHAGTTGYFSLCKAAKACVSSFRCAFTSSGGVNANH
jgi:hypothetical protein